MKIIRAIVFVIMFPLSLIGLGQMVNWYSFFYKKTITNDEETKGKKMKSFKKALDMNFRSTCHYFGL